MRLLRRLALRVVPRQWRATVERDLLEEASRRPARDLQTDAWVSLQAVRIGAAFRTRKLQPNQSFMWGRTPGSRFGLDRLRVDLRQTWRTLWTRRGSTVGTVAVLTIGIGLAAAIFALADPYLSRPLPYRDPERLVIMDLQLLPDVSPLAMTVPTPAPTLADWRQRTDLFQDVAAYGAFERVRLTTPQGAMTLGVWSVSPNLLSMLGAESGFAVRPSGPGGVRPLIVSAQIRDRLALTGVGAGATYRADSGDPVSLVATLPPGFVFPQNSTFLRPDAVVPVEFGAVIWRVGERGRSELTGIARLQSGTSPVVVEAALSAGLATAGVRVRVRPLDVYLSEGIRPLALGAFLAGLMIALVCAANVMNLVVARGIYRLREFATRRALGASQFDLLRLVALEATALGAVAVVTSLLVARVVITGVAQVIPESYVAIGQPVVDLRVVVFTVLLTSVIMLACAFPLWFGARSAQSAAISRARQDEPRAVRKWRFLLAAGQTAIAMMLLVGAMFLARSYANLWLQDTGYAREARLISVSYPNSRNSQQFTDTVSSTIAALRRVPGITDAAAGVFVGPLMDKFDGGGGPLITIGSQRMLFTPSQVTPGYFSVVGTTLVAGRALEPADHGWAAVVVNEAFASRFWPREPVSSVVGQSITGNGQPGVVVGVTKDTHDRALDVLPRPRLYRPLDTWTGWRRLSYAIRVAAGTPIPDEAIRRATIAVDPEAQVEAIDSVYERLAESVRDRSFATLILGLFAAAGLGVSGTGIFAVVAFVAARRTREIAIRMALGANAADVRRLVIRDAMLATIAGGITGLVASHWLAKTLESQLYGVTAGDLLTPAMAAIGLLAVTVAAAWWPTRRALRLEPTVALRVE